MSARDCGSRAAIKVVTAEVAITTGVPPAPSSKLIGSYRPCTTRWTRYSLATTLRARTNG